MHRNQEPVPSLVRLVDRRQSCTAIKSHGGGWTALARTVLSLRLAHVAACSCLALVPVLWRWSLSLLLPLPLPLLLCSGSALVAGPGVPVTA